MVRCTAQLMWILVIGIICLNAVLLWKYHGMLEAAERGSSSPHLLAAHLADAQQQHPANSNHDGRQLPPSLSSDGRNAEQQQQQQDPLKYRGPVVDGRFAIPEISKASKSPWGRLLHQHKVRIVPSCSSSSVGATAASSSSSSSSSLLSLSSSSSTKSDETDYQMFDENNYDAADLLVSKIVPIKLWRLDPLVPLAAQMTKAAIQKQDAAFRGNTRRVKHHATIQGFRWPWNLDGTNNKMLGAWLDSTPAREEVFKRVSSLIMTSSLNDRLRQQHRSGGGGGVDLRGGFSSLQQTIQDALQSGEMLSDHVAQEIESILATNHRLPLFARRMLSSRLRARKIFQSTGCNVLRIPFTSPTEDDKCIAYLSDLKNWKKLKPLPARYDARTIKFQVEFSEPDLHSVIKVSQRLFPYEAFAEIGAFHADRILGVRRITPTAYVCIPKDMIREAVRRDGPTIEADEETLKESGVKTYEEWVEKDLLQFSVHSRYNRDDHGDCVGASIQPLFADVHHLLDSALVVPYKTHDKSWHGYFNLTTDLSVGSSSSADAAGHHHHHHQKNLLGREAGGNDDNNKKKGGGDGDGGDANKNKKKKPVGPYGEHVDPEDFPLRFLSSPYVGTVLHMAELVAFDYIVGNNDRSPNKNSFVVGSCVDDFSVCTEDETSFFAVQRNRDDENKIEQQQPAAGGGGGGGDNDEKKSVEQVVKIDWRADKSALRRAGVPTFIHIDQGMAFYQTPTDNALTKSLKAKDKRGFCIFRRRFINRILDLFGAERDVLGNGEPEHIVRMLQRVAMEDTADYSEEKRRNGFAKLMEARVPPKAMHAAVLTQSTFNACERRMRKVLLQLSRCLSELPIEQVIAP